MNTQRAQQVVDACTRYIFLENEHEHVRRYNYALLNVFIILYSWQYCVGGGAYTLENTMKNSLTQCK